MNFDPVTGAAWEDRSRKLTDFFGTAYSSKLSPNAQKATFGDLMEAHGLFPLLAQGVAAGPRIALTPADLTSIMDAIQAKGGWRYDKNIMPSACCTCVG